MSIEIGPIVEIGTNPIEVEEITSTITEVIGPTIGIEVDQGIIGMEIITGEAIVLKTIKEITIEIEMEAEKEKLGPLQDLDLVLVSTQTGIDLDAIDVVSMTIVQENALMH